MVFKKVCSLLFVVNLVSFAQNNGNTREALLEQLTRRTDIKITESGEKDILKIEYPDGKVIYENIGEYTPKPINSIIYSPTFDSTIIDLRTIDTSHYYQKYSFWQEVNVGTYNTNPPLVGDVNKNGFAEIYGIMKSYNSDYSDVVVMEMNVQGGFDSIYSYDSTSVAKAIIYDIEKDGRDELYLHRFPHDTNYAGHSYLFFKKPTDSSFATELSFVFYPFPENNQLNKNTFGDWDGDEFTDQILLRNFRSNIHVYEYNPLTNNFDSVYSYDPFQYAIYFSGFAIGDFDNDGYTDFFSGGVNGKVVSIENCGDNCYEPGWHGMVETNNAYLYAATNDLDGNGKPELWIGGYHFQDGIGITRITIFEANGNNNYEAVGKIDIIGAFNFNAKNMQVLDVDKDGKVEVMLCIEQHVIILKFSGEENHHTFEIFYLKRNDLAFNGKNSVIYGATMYDVTNDGKEDIIIHLDEIIPDPDRRLFTYIYKADFSVDLKNEEGVIPNKFQLHQNYPNPFNPVTTIRFEIPLSSQTTVKVYNILGKEIITLLNKDLNPGNYTIDWEAKDINGNVLPSGIYIIKLSAISGINLFTRTIKAMFLK